MWLVEAGARRQKWIDQAQSLNIYMGGASGKKLDETYKLAWLRGLKTTYYLRTMGATHAEKSTVEGRRAQCRYRLTADCRRASLTAGSATASATLQTARRRSSARSTIRRCEACQ